MFSILGLIGGGLFRLLPTIFSLVQDILDKRHELAMTQLQISSAENIAKLRASMFSQEIDLKAHEQLYQTLSVPITGNKVVDLLNAIVRPSVVYTLLALYVAAKVICWWLYIHASSTFVGVPMFILSDSLFNSFDETMLSSIISFYFLGRVLDNKSN